ncbi:MAG: DEAD/DEAH box helicase [Bifidobacteriaceae bacterium]|jgi:ATP-dependent RNA helicase HelY|nr:DEAD/DEAH box helicase [Bifidobacteriaceae bacterium]
MSAAEPSAAEAFAAYKRRARHRAVDQFADGLDFPLDPFQREACEAIDGGEGVLVAAPTGAGKTVVAWFAIERALERGERAFYTTPIKALSNQKFRELADRLGEDRVGLLTGDQSIRPEAPVVVMTTEVLRNMIYAGGDLDRLGAVVVDEVHYLADRFRGPVWEEVLIQLPAPVQVVCLSATVSNAEEFGDWLTEVRGALRVVVSDTRPVPLWQHVLVPTGLKDLYAPTARSAPDDAPHLNPELLAWAPGGGAGGGGAGGRPRRGRPGARSGRGGHLRPPPRFAVAEALDREGLLPAIFFVFSRAGCEAAVEACRRAGLVLTTPEETRVITEAVERAALLLPAGDLAVVGYQEFLDGARAGFAAHHAGMLPIFKETIELLFQQGLVKLVFATETLSLGINMPARTVVLDRLDKWDGTTHADLTPGEYTQLTGRAGRRGLDVEGHAVVVAGGAIDPGRLLSLASKRTYPLRSAFRPTYNMAVNLTERVGTAKARAVLELSFAQFQADRAVVSLARQAKALDEAITGYRKAMTCDLGDFAAYQALRDRLSQAEKGASREAARGRVAGRDAVVAGLTRGDVLRLPAGKHRGLALVLEPGHHTPPAPLALTERGQLRRLGAAELGPGLVKVAHIKVGPHVKRGDPQVRRDLVSRMAAAAADAPAPARPAAGTETPAAIATLRAELRAHPCHRCPDREAHARWARRAAKAEADRARLGTSIDRRTGSIARQFDQVQAVLEDLGYLEPGSGDGDVRHLTPAGRILARIYAERDLALAECVRTGVWDGLTPAALAATVAALVFETRSDNPPPVEPLPGPVRAGVAAAEAAAGRIADAEAAHGLVPSAGVDPAASAAIWRWASGQPLVHVLVSDLLSPGDFVRLAKQVLDVLDHIQAVAPTEALYGAARAAMAAVRRGVVAADTT